MSYKSIHIPFATGQDESVDVKLLPDGKFRAVQNMALQRDGRMVRREAMAEREIPDNRGVVALMGEDGIVYRKGNAINQVFDSDGVSLTEKLGRVSPTHSVEYLMADLEHVSREESLLNTSGLGLKGAGDQLSPSAAISSRFLFTCYAFDRFVTVEVRDRETFQVVNSFRSEFSVGAGFSGGRILACKVACNAQGTRLAVVRSGELEFLDTNISGGNMGLRVYTIDEDGRESLRFEESIVRGDSITPHAEDPQHRWDVSASALPQYQDFILALMVNNTTFQLREYSFETGAHTVLHSATVDTEITRTEDVTEGQILKKAVSCSCLSGANWYFFSYASHRKFSESFYMSRSVPGAATGMIGGSLSHARQFCELPNGKVFVCDIETFPVPGATFDRKTYARVGVFDPASGSFDTSDNRIVEMCLPVTQPVPVRRLRFGDFSVRIGCEMAYYEPDFEYYPDSSEDEIFGPGAVNALEFYQGLPASADINSSLLPAGGRNLHWEEGDLSSRYDSYSWRSFYYRNSLPKAVTFTDNNGDIVVIYPLELSTPNSTSFRDEPPDEPPPHREVIRDVRAQIRSVWAVTRDRVSSTRSNVSAKTSERLIAGGSLVRYDGERAMTYFSGAPILRPNFVSALPDASLAWFVAVLEHQDAHGRTMMSAPSAPIGFSFATETDDRNLKFDYEVPMGGPPSRLAIYYGGEGENPSDLFRFFDSVAVLPGTRGKYPRDIFALSPYDIVLDKDAKPLYTQSGEIPNDPPPPCETVVRGRNRVWLAGLPRKGAIQASKILNEYEAVHWSNFDNFQVLLPDDVTGLGAMDDSIVAFTRNGVFGIHGAGPDNQGIGGFSEPQVIPSTVGCISPESVVSAGDGIYFLSQRGIEVVPRGLASPQWIGQAVRDTLEAFPVCASGAFIPDDSTVRWLFVNQDRSESVVIVLDKRSNSWHTYTYEGTHNIAGVTSLGGELSFTLARAGSPSGLESETRTEALAGELSFVETGDIRLAGLQGWMFGRRVHILGHWGGRACDVTLFFAFDGEDYRPEDRYTWRLSDAEFRANSPIELELTLPVQLFSSLRCKIQVDPVSESGDYSFRANGLTVFYETAAEGPRLGTRSKG